MIPANENTLAHLIAQPNRDFEQVYRGMQHEHKLIDEKILVYFDKVIDYLLEDNGIRSVKCIHIHFPSVEECLKEVVLEFLTIKLFYRSLEQDKSSSDYIVNRLQNLSAKLSRNQLPLGASAKNGGNKEYKDWYKRKTELRNERDFLSSISDTRKGLFPNVVLNTLIQDSHVIEHVYFTISVENLASDKKAYILRNTNKFTTLIKALHSKGVVQNIRDVILFDCTGRSLFNACTSNQLERYKEEDVCIEHLIVISFGKNTFRLKQLIDKCTSIYQKHFNLPQNVIPNSGTYIFLENELEKLLKKEPSHKDITWIEGATNEVAIYLKLTHVLDIPQLRTIYVFNLFMTAMTSGISNMIFQRLFCNENNEELFNIEVHEAIAILADEERDELEEAIDALLKKIVEIWGTAKADILRTARNKGRVALIVPLSLENNASFNKEMRIFFNGIDFKAYSWKNIKEESIKSKVILTFNYKDTGRYPFNIFPNILETNIKTGKHFYAFFLSSLFRKRYEQCIQEYNTELGKRVRNKFRRKYLGQEELVSETSSMQSEVIFEDVDDQEQDLGEPQASVNVTYTDDSHSSFYPSKILVIQIQEEESFNVVRADLLTESDKGCKVQLLEELYADLNLFPISPEEESELARIKLEYDVTGRDTVLWKVLLALKKQDITDQALYEHIAGIIGDSRFVHYQYFRNNWLDPQSELLIPRKRRHFRAICQYLGLPPNYYRLKLKKSASEKWSKRNSTRKMNKLLIQMFNEGLFNDGFNWNNIRLEHLLITHDLEENGITEENIGTELQALVALLKENIHLKMIKNIELP